MSEENIKELVNLMKKRFLSNTELKSRLLSGFKAEEQVIIEKDIKREAKKMGERIKKRLLNLYLKQNNKKEVN